MSVDDITKWLDEAELQRVSTGEGIGDLSQCYPFQFDGPKRAAKALRTAVEALDDYENVEDGQYLSTSSTKIVAQEALASIRKELGIKEATDGRLGEIEKRLNEHEAGPWVQGEEERHKSKVCWSGDYRWLVARLKEAKAFYGQLIERPADTEWIHDRACEHLSKLEASDGEK